MNILRKGDINKINRIKRFNCKNCGCLFEANKDEYRVGSQYNEEYYYCKCPFCHEFVYGEIKNN